MKRIRHLTEIPNNQKSSRLIDWCSLQVQGERFYLSFYVPLKELSPISETLSHRITLHLDLLQFLERSQLGKAVNLLNAIAIQSDLSKTLTGFESRDIKVAESELIEIYTSCQ